MTDDNGSAPKAPLLQGLHRVYVESLAPEEHRNSPKNDRSRTDVPFLDALALLAASDELDQLQKWHITASALARRPELLNDAEISDLDGDPAETRSLDGFVALVGSPARHSLGGDLPGLVAATIRDGLVTFAEEAAAVSPDSPARRLTHADWRRFHDLVLQPLDLVVKDLAVSLPARPAPLTPLTIDRPFAKPGCNDEEVDSVGGTPTIVSRFWSKLPLEDFKKYVNPIWWPRLGSAYWKEMKIRPGSKEMFPGGYSAIFDEVVDLPSGLINAQLRVTFTATDEYALTSYHETTSRTDAVVRDAGYVFATIRTFPPEDGYQTLVYSTKSIWFEDDELNGWADLACDNGWVDLMIRMAIPEDRRLPHQPGDQPMPDGGAVAADAYDADELDDLAEKVCAAIDGHVDALKAAVGATLDGDLGKQHLEPMLTACHRWVGVAGAGAKSWRRVVADLSDSWEPR
jgi:hypothetical protein